MTKTKIKPVRAIFFDSWQTSDIQRLVAKARGIYKVDNGTRLAFCRKCEVIYRSAYDTFCPNCGTMLKGQVFDKKLMDKVIRQTKVKVRRL